MYQFNSQPFCIVSKKIFVIKWWMENSDVANSDIKILLLYH